VETIDIQALADEVSKDIGKKISPKKRDFALLKATQPGLNNTDITREIADTKHPKQDGYKLANDPAVIALKDKIDKLQLFGMVEINPTLIKNGLLKEAVEVKDSRDRRGA